MQIDRLAIHGLLLITPRRFEDARGWFTESWNGPALIRAGIELPDFVQDNHSFSAQRHTLRGLHYQRPPRAQDKLVRCTRGKILDVAVDARKGSPQYGRALSVELSAENGAQLYVPKGFLHGFLTLCENCEVQYKCTDVYASNCDGSVAWDSVGFEWGITDPALSDKDAQAIAFNDFDSPFEYTEDSA